MTWNYRVVRHPPKEDEKEHGVFDFFAIHEIFYDDHGNAYSMTADPVDFSGDSKEECISSLCMALADACKHPVFEIPETWANLPWTEDEPMGFLTTPDQEN